MDWYHKLKMSLQGTDDGSNPGASTITVHKDTANPTKAWQKLAVKRKVEKVEPINPDTPISEDKIRFVCMSDTHAQIQKNPGIIPPGDVILHAGDFTNVGALKEVKEFDEFLGQLPHRLKVVIAGNHDMTFDENMVKNRRKYLKDNFSIQEKDFEDALQKYGVNSAKELLSHCIYLEDSEFNLCGIKIYGSPWQPEFCDWGFNLQRGQQCLDKWDLIPADTDILITHGPPIGHGDSCFDGQKAGCVELLTTVEARVKPKYHIFGHIHEGYGCTTDGQTTFINASTCTLRYKPLNPPIVFDYPVPDGQSKEQLLSAKQHEILVRNKKL